MLLMWSFWMVGMYNIFSPEQLRQTFSGPQLESHGLGRLTAMGSCDREEKWHSCSYQVTWRRNAGLSPPRASLSSPYPMNLKDTARGFVVTGGGLSALLLLPSVSDHRWVQHLFQNLELGSLWFSPLQKENWKSSRLIVWTLPCPSGTMYINVLNKGTLLP